MTPEQIEHSLANDQFVRGDGKDKIALAQLSVSLEILKELRQLCQKINDDMPIEPVRVNVEGAVEVFNP